MSISAGDLGGVSPPPTRTVKQIVDLSRNPIRWSVEVDGREVWAREDPLVRPNLKMRESIAREQERVAARYCTENVLEVISAWLQP